MAYSAAALLFNDSGSPRYSEHNFCPVAKNIYRFSVASREAFDVPVRVCVCVVDPFQKKKRLFKDVLCRSNLDGLHLVTSNVSLESYFTRCPSNVSSPITSTTLLSFSS